ncbi:MAG: APC family permease [Acidobacteriota bacterium]
MQLFREVGLLSSTFLVVGNIIGIGIFTTSGLIAAETGSSPWLVGVWVLGGFLALIGAICYSLLSVQRPLAGGEYAFLYPSYGPFAAFLSGWASLLIGFSAPIAASALGLAAYMSPFFPSEISEHPLAQKGIAELILLCISIFLTVGLKFGNRLHSVITMFNLALTIGFATLVLRRAPVMQNLEPIIGGRSSSLDLPALGSAIVMVMFAYSGWNAAAYIAEEIRRPQRYIPGALLLGTGTVIVVYLLMNLAYFGAVPLAQLQGEIAVAEVTALATFGTEGMIIVNVLILFSILSSITAMSIAGPRVYFAMSRDHLFPKWLAEVDQKKKIPLKSIWFQSLIALILVGVGTFRQILIYSGFILLLFSTLTVSVLFMTRNGKDDHPYFWILYRFLPALFVLINTVVLVNAAVSNPKETLAGIITLALGIPVYFYYRGRA